MKNLKNNFIAFIILLFFSNSAIAQSAISDTQKFASLCKVWGFLKYYHPVVATGKFDWDQQLVDQVKLLPTINTKDQLSGLYLNWIKSLGDVPRCRSCDNNLPDSQKRNLDLRWMDDKYLFTDSLSNALHYIQQNRAQRDYYYAHFSKGAGIDFSNEKEYSGMVYPDYPLRLLSLFRYWNIINYFYPYKYAIGKNWSAVLDEMIPQFKDAPDTLAYHLAMLRLVRNLNDTHAMFGTDQLRAFNGNRYSPVMLSIYNDTVLVTGYNRYALSNKSELLPGDRILKIEGKDVNQIIKEKLELTMGSNDAVRLRNVVAFILRGKSDSLEVTYERKGAVLAKKIKLYPAAELKIDTAVSGSNTWKMLDHNVGYINMAFLKLDKVDEAMAKFAATKALIFDLRNYPYDVEKKLVNYLNPYPKTFVKTTVRNISYPGTFVPMPPASIGEENKNYYKGKVILLVNEETQSHGEFITMALQTAPNIVTIGSQTAGADGNVVKIVFPGGYSTYMSGIGVYYPDGRETQRVGLSIDIVVKPTAKGVIEGRDEVLEKAIAVANDSK